MLTRITDRKIPCVYIHVYQIIKNWGPGPYNSLRHADNRRYFSGLSLMRNWGEARVLLSEGSGKIWTCSCWKKGNFIMINEFKYGQTWKIWPSRLSLSLYSTFKQHFLKTFLSYWKTSGFHLVPKYFYKKKKCINIICVSVCVQILPSPCWFFLNNSKTVKAVPLAFYSIQ